MDWMAVWMPFSCELGISDLRDICFGVGGDE